MSYDFDGDDGSFDDESDNAGYRDGPPVRCCERCGAGENKSKPYPICVEVQLAFGLVSWICHDCRKDWHRMFKGHELNKKYSQASFRLEFWKSRIGPETPAAEVEVGLELLNVVDDLELEINEVANRWLISGCDEIRSI